MPSDAKWYLICYDVRDDKRLRKVAKHLEGYGTRMQYSIFRCWLSDVQLQRLRWELTVMVDPVDDIMFLPICSRCLEGLEVTHASINRPNWPQEPKSHQIV
jgi:CRISPR-associated protein Cas2